MRRLGLYAELVAFQHTIFALPFAFMGMILGARGWPGGRPLALVTLAMVGARTAAMCFNRIADARFDRLNPRTAGRPLPSGRLSRGRALALLGAAIAIFVGAAAGLNRLCLLLSPVALAVILSYSLTKRFSALSHLHLGASLGIAPIASWIAVTGRPAWTPVILGLAVAAWTAGFDVMYACQDVEIDRRLGLHSLPARFGIPVALRMSSALHLLMVALLVTLGLSATLGWVYFAAVILVAGILYYEHHIIRADDLSKINVAFFTANGWTSVGLLTATVVELAAR
ncbi:MAG: UbiA family prenyltransferase [Acidobacteria bacterium]|nr:UbiA family prenyltransferase [Acidobacteriota bacterium]